MRPRTVLAACALVASGISGYAVLSEDGLSRMRRQREEAARLSADVDKLRAENERLKAEARRLEGEGEGADAYLEKVVRDELGYVRKNEHVLLLDEAPAGAEDAEARP